LRNDNRVRLHLRSRSHPGELPWTKRKILVGEKADQLDGAGGRVYFASGKREFPRVSIGGAVGEHQLQLEFLLMSDAGIGVRILSPISQVRLLTRGKVNLDGIDFGNRCKWIAVRADQIA